MLVKVVTVRHSPVKLLIASLCEISDAKTRYIKNQSRKISPQYNANAIKDAIKEKLKLAKN